MKKLLLLSLLLAFTAGIHAQTADKKWGFGAAAGAYGTLNNSNVGLMPELYFSRYLSPRLDLMLKTDFGLFNSDLNNNLDLVNPILNLRYKLSGETKKLRPYLYAGPGLLADNETTGLNFDLGAGAKYYIKEATALYFSAGYVHGIESISKGITGRDNFWKATAGLEFDFGTTLDSDMDGVSDKKDKCPNTPTGVAVDVNGCPIDTDGDGVADYIDDCPAVAGLTSLKGCPDTDKDGIADKDDACPSLAGVASLKGCPDTDGDGVTDKDDKCPGTKKGYKVDPTGCPLDTDKDGVINEEDDCPTVAGLKENKGCPKKELTTEETEVKKMKVEPVYFDTNKADFIQGEKSKIDNVVNLLKENSDYNVAITGHTDNSGTEVHNLNLSNNRASSVVKTILAGKIKKNRIVSQKGLGETSPASTNDTPDGMAKNRRVEFEMIKTK